jgi:uncharacterized MAPEG superfamily protein
MSSDRPTPGSPTSSAAQPTPHGADQAQAGVMDAARVFIAAVVVIVAAGIAAGLVIVLSLH